MISLFALVCVLGILWLVVQLPFKRPEPRLIIVCLGIVFLVYALLNSIGHPIPIR